MSKTVNHLLSEDNSRLRKRLAQLQNECEFDPEIGNRRLLTKLAKIVFRIRELSKPESETHQLCELMLRELLAVMPELAGAVPLVTPRPRPREFGAVVDRVKSTRIFELAKSDVE